jgi:hypothetical protein
MGEATPRVADALAGRLASPAWMGLLVLCVHGGACRRLDGLESITFD